MVLLSAVAEYDDDANFERSLAVLTDVTDKRRAEQALRESEERYRYLVENSTDTIYVTDGG